MIKHSNNILKWQGYMFAWVWGNAYIFPFTDVHECEKLIQILYDKYDQTCSISPVKALDVFPAGPLCILRRLNNSKSTVTLCLLLRGEEWELQPHQQHWSDAVSRDVIKHSSTTLLRGWNNLEGNRLSNGCFHNKDFFLRSKGHFLLLKTTI